MVRDDTALYNFTSLSSPSSFVLPDVYLYLYLSLSLTLSFLPSFSISMVTYKGWRDLDMWIPLCALGTR